MLRFIMRCGFFCIWPEKSIRGQLDYRPSPKQRSVLELIQYLSMMGPAMVSFVKAGAFDPADWRAAEHAASALNLDAALGRIGRQPAQFSELLSGFSEGDFQGEIEMFGRKASRAYLLVNIVLCSYAAYRTQLFLYLKACGREELNTMNLWAGVDGAM